MLERTAVESESRCHASARIGRDGSRTERSPRAVDSPARHGRRSRRALAV